MSLDKKDIIAFSIAIILSLIIKWQIGEFYLSAIYTVLGIMFSIAIGVVVSFNLQGVKKKSVVSKIRKNIKTVRTNYIKYFIISTFLYLLDKYFRDHFKGGIYEITRVRNFPIEINSSIILIVMLLFGIFYYIVNFIEMQKLNDELYDEMNLK